MRILGLTGGIACGKSHVSACLAALGAVIIDGDLLARELTAPSGAALPAIRAAFGECVFFADGTLNRKALGSLVFGDDSERNKLDSLMQPMIRARILEEIGAAEQQGASVCVLDMPLLYEKGLDALCDRVWCVFLPPDEQRRRLMLRDGCTQAEAEARIASQLPAEEKAARADVVIDTSGSLQDTAELIPALLRA